MGNQAQFIENTIRDMKKAMSRDDDGSDSDTSFTKSTNRGNKLKRKAKYVREGRLAQADGPQVYKRRIMYNGYARNVISRNPPRVDQDGDVVDTDNENSDLDSTDAEDDPYRDVRLENILMPLTSAADLDKHPSLSVPYTNRILEDMVQTVQDMVQREQTVLWRIKNLQTSFRGDEPYAPCSMFQAEERMDDFEERQYNVSTAISVVNETEKTPAPVTSWDNMTDASWKMESQSATDAASAANRQEAASDGTSMEGELHSGKDAFEEYSNSHDQSKRTSEQQDGASSILEKEPSVADHAPLHESTLEVSNSTSNQENARSSGANEDIISTHNTVATDRDEQLKDPKVEASEHTQTDENGAQQSSDQPNSNGHNIVNESEQQQPSPQTDGPTTAPPGTDIQDHAMEDGQPPDTDNDNSNEESHRRMTTRAGARAQATIPTPPLSTSGGALTPNLSTMQPSIPQVHPFFLQPPSSLPNPSGGLLSPGLADEARRQISLYVQKQAEVVRQANEMLVGLRRALRLKNTVWDWCRSEGHVGEMSDGEDWIDVEKWQVEEGALRKGEEVDDDETPSGMVAKKTRNRRAAG